MSEIFNEVIQGLLDGVYSIFNRPDVIVLQLIATFLLFLIIRIFFWKPIVKYLENRQTAINKELYEAHYENQRIQQIKTETIESYEQVKLETVELKEKLFEEAFNEKERIVKEAQDEAKRRLNHAELEIKQKYKEAQAEIKESVKKLAFYAAEQIVEKEIKRETYDELVDEIIAESEK